MEIFKIILAIIVLIAAPLLCILSFVFRWFIGVQIVLELITTIEFFTLYRRYMSGKE